jgi:hypothetical protein
MASNLITTPLADRQVGGPQDVLPFLNKEAIPLMREMRTKLNSTQVQLLADRAAAIAAPTDLASALVAIDAIRQVLIDFGLTAA